MRSSCYQINYNFEDIEVKKNAPTLLESALSKEQRKCMIGTDAMCNPYMQCEQKLMLTRCCLEIIYKYGFGAAMQTKSELILRDIGLYKSINERTKSVVQMTQISLNSKASS